MLLEDETNLTRFWGSDAKIEFDRCYVLSRYEKAMGVGTEPVTAQWVHWQREILKIESLRVGIDPGVRAACKIKESPAGKISSITYLSGFVRQTSCLPTESVLPWPALERFLAGTRNWRNVGRTPKYNISRKAD